MELIPAIDLLDGRCVRLHRGDFAEVTWYEPQSVELASAYAEAGADWLHVVDLAASRDGAAADIQPLLKLLRAAPQNVQTGGGVRCREDVEARLEAGADRVVVGSVCAGEPGRFGRWLSSIGPDRLVAALDVQIANDGVAWPRIHGWTKTAERSLHDLLDELVDGGLRHLLCTDISRDGAMQGPNTTLYMDLVNRYPQLEIQASGGVSQLADLRQLAATGAAGAITGKALLDGVFSVREALEAVA